VPHGELHPRRGSEVEAQLLLRIAGEQTERRSADRRRSSSGSPDAAKAALGETGAQGAAEHASWLDCLFVCSFAGVCLRVRVVRGL
jgi:hypothetical protein